MGYIVGADVGGTFTDCVLVDRNGRILTDKSFSIPGNPGEGMIRALENVAGGNGLALERVLGESDAVCIGTTSLTNKLITRAGAKVGLIATKGHEDAVLIGRVFAKTQGLPDAHKTDVLQWGKPEPLVARALIRGIDERIDYKGAVIVRLADAEIERVVGELVAAGAEAIAISLLWSFINPEHEERIRRFIQAHHPSIHVSVGHRVAPVLGEYERTNAAIMSAYLGAAARQDMSGMRARLGQRGLAQGFLVMQSNGGCIWDDEVGDHPLNLLASGPAGGIIGSAKLGALLGHRSIIATDMGGTSFEVGVITDGTPVLSEIAVHDRFRMALAHIEVVSIGAGGGSIAWVDAMTGTLQVGPRSAGAVPGPVAYDTGGVEPTVTDADVVLGRIDPARFFNGRKRLDHDRAFAAIRDRIAAPLGMDVHRAAQGILDIVDGRMGDLIRKLTIERGHDPRDFVLFAYGGAGPTHVGAYAREVGLSKAVVSPFAAVFSALGIASSDIVRVYSHSAPLRAPFPADRVNAAFDRLETQAGGDLHARGVRDGARLERFLEMRFRHQVHQVKVPVEAGRLDASKLEQVVARFVALYEQSFGKGTAITEAGVEAITFHLVATTPRAPLLLERRARGRAPAEPVARRAVYFIDRFVDTPIFEHAALAPGHKIAGPAIIESANTTLPLHPDQSLEVDDFGNLVITLA